jgi:hypothetical protein
MQYEEPFTINNPCNQKLTEDEYKYYMITHHEVAVYMSKMHLHNTKNPVILEILINVIRTQTYDINLLKNSKVKIIDIIKNYDDELDNKINSKYIKNYNSYIPTVGDFTKPNSLYLSNTFCDPGFFKISHNENLHNMTDAMYIKHMIPHHQVAVDMSKIILKTTNDNFIINFAYRIIRNQQSEISILDTLSKTNYSFESNLL